MPTDPSPQPSRPPTTRLPTTRTPAGGQGTPTTLCGTVERGVESRCIVLTDDSGGVLANLMGIDPHEWPSGSKVEVTGTFQPGLMTTCQQGTPFQVSQVTPL